MKRELRDHRRSTSAVDAINGFDHETEIFGFTKGGFSFIDLIRATLDITGPASLTISTWTAARADTSDVFDLIQSGLITDTRWLVDFSFQRREPALAQELRRRFGPDAVRVAKNHAKFALIHNDAWQIVIRTSMNLNHNPRFEDFTIAHDPQLAQFLTRIIDELWRKQPAALASDRPGAIGRWFDKNA